MTNKCSIMVRPILKFGIPITKLPDNKTGTLFDLLPNELNNKIEELGIDLEKQDALKKIKNLMKKYTNSQNYLKFLLRKYAKEYGDPDEKERLKREPYLILDPTQLFTLQWIYLAADILSKEDLKKGFWYNTLYHLIEIYVDFDFDNNVHLLQTVQNNANLCAENLEILFKKMNYKIDTSKNGWYFNAFEWLRYGYFDNFKNKKN